MPDEVEALYHKLVGAAAVLRTNNGHRNMGREPAAFYLWRIPLLRIEHRRRCLFF